MLGHNTNQRDTKLDLGAHSVGDYGLTPVGLPCHLVCLEDEDGHQSWTL